MIKASDITLECACHSSQIAKMTCGSIKSRDNIKFVSFGGEGGGGFLERIPCPKQTCLPWLVDSAW